VHVRGTLININEMATDRRIILWTGIKNITFIGIIVLVSYCLSVNFRISMLNL
jgi:hypothetical protein